MLIGRPAPIDASLDIWVWVTCLVLLGVLGARAWFVETGRVRLGRAPAKVRALTGASVGVLAVLAVLVTTQGGYLLFHSIVTGTDPADTIGTQVAADPPVAGDPAAPGGPAAGGEPAPPAAPPAGGGPAAPPGG